MAPRLDPSDPSSIPLVTVTYDEPEFAAADIATRRALVHVAGRLEEVGAIARHGRASHEWAVIDLDMYHGWDAYLARCAKIQKGAALRQARKAGKLDCHTKFFDAQTFVGDIAAIEASAPERQGRPVPARFLRSADERGGFPAQYREPKTPDNALVWNRHFGIFKPSPGHRQGEVVVDEQLLGYILLRRVGSMAFYGTILGGAQWLAHGIMYELHLRLVRYLLDRCAETPAGAEPDASVVGLRYLLYAGYFGAGEGLRQWKKKMLFEPRYVEFDYPSLDAPAAVGSDADRSRASRRRPPSEVSRWVDTILGLDETGRILRTADGDIELPDKPGEADHTQVELEFDEQLRVFLAKLGVAVPFTGPRRLAASTAIEPPASIDVLGRQPVEIGAFSIVGSVPGFAALGRYCTLAKDLVSGDDERSAGWLTTSSFADNASPPALWRHFEQRLRQHVAPGPDGAPQQIVGAAPQMRIGNDVRIGDGVHLDAGVSIGDGAVIESLAVVREDVPLFAVVSGNPARVVRYRLPDELIERIVRVRWWRFSTAELARLNMTQVEASLDALEQRIAAGTIAPYEPGWVTPGWIRTVIDQLKA